MKIKNILAEAVLTYIHYLSEDFLDFTEILLKMDVDEDIISAAKKIDYEKFNKEDLKILNKII